MNKKLVMITNCCICTSELVEAMIETRAIIHLEAEKAVWISTEIESGLTQQLNNEEVREQCPEPNIMQEAEING